MTHEDDDFITDITPAEAIAEHEDGAMHCCTEGRWQQIAPQLDIKDHPWLDGHIGFMRMDDSLRLVCIDTKGLEDTQVAYVLLSFYGPPDEVSDVGVMMLDGDSVQAKKMYDAKKYADMRRFLKHKE